MGAVVMYMIVGEVMRWSDLLFADNGYGPEWIHDHQTWVRLGGLAFAAVNALPTFLVYRRDWYLDRMIAQSKKEPATAICDALTTTQILKVALMESVGVIGLVLYVLGGERIDLYLFNGLALAGFLLVWPSCAQWERAFRRHAHTNPEIPADPWHAG